MQTAIKSVTQNEEISTIQMVSNPIDNLVDKGFLDEMSESVWRARLVMSALSELQAARPDVYATPEGYVHFEWHNGRQFVLLVFLADGSVELETNDVMTVTTSNSLFFPTFTSTDIAELTVEALKNVG